MPGLLGRDNRCPSGKRTRILTTTALPTRSSLASCRCPRSRIRSSWRCRTRTTLRQNASLRLHDASYYNGKYYLYLGVTPVVLLFLPFRALGFGDLPQGAAVAAFTFAGVVFWFLTVSLVRRMCVPHRGAGVLYATLVTLGFGGAIPFLLRRPAMYEVAIGCGFFCLAATVYFLVSATFDERTTHWKAGLGSLFLGLAVGARPNLVLAAPLLWLTWRWRREQGYQQLRRLATALVVPLFAVLVLLACYNFARFGSPTEFGTSYQLAGLDVRLLFADTRRVPFLAYFYLWHPCELNSVFPYVHASLHGSPAMPGFTVVEPVAGVSFTTEPVAGVFFTTPFLGVLALLPIVWGWAPFGATQARSSGHLRTLGRLAWSLVALAALQIVFLSTRSGATMRYIPDFSGVLVTAAGLVLFGLDLRWRRAPWAVWLIRALLVPLVVLSVFFNLAIGVTGTPTISRAATPRPMKRFGRPPIRLRGQSRRLSAEGRDEGSRTRRSPVDDHRHVAFERTLHTANVLSPNLCLNTRRSCGKKPPRTSMGQRSLGS